MQDGTGVASIYTKNIYTCLVIGNTGCKEDCFVTNSYYVCALHFILHACVKLYTHVHAWFDATRVFLHLHTQHTQVSQACTV